MNEQKILTHPNPISLLKMQVPEGRKTEIEQKCYRLESSGKKTKTKQLRCNLFL